MNSKNVLILSAGRRVELVQSFKQAFLSLNMTNAKIVCVDISKYAPALYFADKYFIIPKISDTNYIQSIIDISIKEDIDLIIPTIDTELEKLSENKFYIEDSTKSKVLISDKHCIDICNNKIKTINFLKQNGFNVPFTLSDEDIKKKNYSFPLFIKPCFGSSSQNTFIIKNEQELDFFIQYVDKPIIQEMIFADEYTVDICLDFHSNVISIVPRIRLTTRSGEILQGKIDKNKIIIDDIKKLMKVLRPIGHISVQCFLVNDKVYYIEINPRFSGGAPMSFYAGANSPEFLLKVLTDEKVPYYEDYENGVVFSRFDSCIKVVKEND